MAGCSTRSSRYSRGRSFHSDEIAQWRQRKVALGFSSCIRDASISFNARAAKWYYPPLPQTPPSNESAALAIAAIRTDLDVFNSTECRLLETWGFAQGLKSWFVAFPHEGPPGSGPKLVAPEISDADDAAIERSSQRKLRIIALNDPFGVLLLVTWLALAVLLTVVLLR